MLCISFDCRLVIIDWEADLEFYRGWFVLLLMFYPFFANMDIVNVEWTVISDGNRKRLPVGSMVFEIYIILRRGHGNCR